MNDEEIEELTNLIFNKDIQILNNYKEEIERLNNIIKEVREYIDYYGITPEQNDDLLLRHILKRILEILDK